MIALRSDAIKYGSGVNYFQIIWNIQFNSRVARGVMVIVVGNGHGDMSSNPGRNWLHFT